MISATTVRFKRYKGDKWERGIAITTAPGLYQCVSIFPSDATSRVDALDEVFEYELEPYHGAFELIAS